MPVPEVSVLICTWNRAAMLRATLLSIATLESTRAWDVVVVDNNSTDATRQVVETLSHVYPVPLRYVFEPRQGRSCAMNTGIAATKAPVVAFTDDDVDVDPKWLAEGCAPLLEADGVEYTGGPVLPIWERPCPTWFASSGPALWGTLAILDYGLERFVFEERRRIPLGVNMAVRRSLFTRVGHFDPEFGRNGASVPLGQEVSEFLTRARVAGARGEYVPHMIVHHHVPASRLEPHYWRRWWYGKGISRARLERLHPITELGLDLRTVPTLAGIPRFFFGNALRDAAGWCAAALSNHAGERVAHETQLCYFIGQLSERVRWRRALKTRPAVHSLSSPR